MIKEWAAAHRFELELNWSRIQVGGTIERIAPLD
jgi:hypothetical protein